jgi:hypothetical protein
MTIEDKTKPDVLRVTEYILEQAKTDTTFSVQSADKSKELNGIGRHRIAQIMLDICLDPNGEGSLITYTTVDDTNMDNNFCRWQLNANAYFSYLSYQSVEQAKISNKTAVTTLRVAIAAMVISIIFPLIAA